jgi:trehalose 6-phosphate synthase
MDYEQFSVTHEDHVSYVKPFPISIAFTNGAEHDEEEKKPDRSALERLGIRTEHLVLGVDRLDYTKGILERMRGIEFLLDSHPEYREKLTFLQIGSPTRQGIERFEQYAEEVNAEVARINAKFKHGGWQPIVFEHVQYSHEQLVPLYRLADVCLVTSLHDGMNLVSKEFVAARHDEAGVLVLSQFTGAARDMKGALVINPYSAEETAEAVHKGLIMSPTEQHRRMKTMRVAVKDYNVYRWAAELIKALAALR